jgi:hypothetical protein
MIIKMMLPTITMTYTMMTIIDNMMMMMMMRRRRRRRRRRSRGRITILYCFIYFIFLGVLSYGRDRTGVSMQKVVCYGRGGRFDTTNAV